MKWPSPSTKTFPLTLLFVCMFITFQIRSPHQWTIWVPVQLNRCCTPNKRSRSQSHKKMIDKSDSVEFRTPVSQDKTVVLDNTVLPTDQNGLPLITDSWRFRFFMKEFYIRLKNETTVFNKLNRKTGKFISITSWLLYNYTLYLH